MGVYDMVSQTLLEIKKKILNGYNERNKQHLSEN